MAAAAQAQDIRLKSRDGGVEVTGRLLDFDGTSYRIETEFGPLTVEASQVVCEGEACPGASGFVSELSVSGSQALAGDLFPTLLEAFARDRGLASQREISGDLNFGYALADEDAQEVARIAFRVGSLTEAEEDLRSGASQIALFDRPVTTDAANWSFARDAVVFVAAGDGPVTSIDYNQIPAILSGAIQNWSELGAEDQPIRLHLPARLHGVSDYLSEEFGVAEEEFSSDAARHQDLAELVDAVAADPLAIGVARYSERGNAGTLALRASCGFELTPTRIGVKTGDYPLALPISIYAEEARLGLLGRDIVSYFQGPQAQAIVRLSGYVDLQTEVETLSEQGDRLINAVSVAGTQVPVSELRRMASVLRGAERLSMSFRFQPGSTELDAGSRSNVRRLSEALLTGDLDGEEVVLIGFSDGVGAADGNRRIGAGRAQAVLDAVLQEATGLDETRVTLATESFGEAMPLACDDDEWGRDINRRVEVWLRGPQR
ncbi:MAG: phosphate ABC transporter substrate-binding/OmpA family protein [Pseudomonadota bacterium]